MNIIFVIYEWIFAFLGFKLHKKMKIKPSLYLCLGLNLMASLMTLLYAGEKLGITTIIFSKIIPSIIVFVPVVTLSSFAVIAYKWDTYFIKK